MKSRVLAWVVGAAVSAGVVTTAVAQKPEDQIKNRRAAFTLVSANFGPIAATVKGERPFNQADVLRWAERVDFVSRLPWEYFTPGSEKGETRAKAEVWSEAAKFKAAGDRFQAEAAKLAQVAKGGDLAQVRAQFGEVAKTCRACHDNFRRD